jgi:hypothetical protein
LSQRERGPEAALPGERKRAERSWEGSTEVSGFITDRRIRVAYGMFRSFGINVLLIR